MPSKRFAPLSPRPRQFLAGVLAALDKRRAVGATRAARYAQHRLAVGEAQAAAVRLSQDIAPVPARADRARWKRARGSLRTFCETYLAETFYLAWSDDQLKVIARLQEAVTRGGLFAFAMPRGGGKTSLAEAACLWAVLYGYRQFVVILTVSAKRSGEIMEELKGLVGFRTEPESPLTLDFGPELLSFLALEGEPRRCLGQRCGGRPTFVRWQQLRLVFGIVPPDGAGRPQSLASGSVVSASGLTGGGVRGQRYRLPDTREPLRPDLVLVDDPQNNKVAASASQVRDRVTLLNGAVLGMAGPNRKIAALATVTVIQPDDVASKLLDHDKSPYWRGERMKMLHGKEENPNLWEEYRQLRLEDIAGGTDRAGQLYRSRRAEMDAGLKATWPARLEGMTSAIEAAMDLKFQDEPTFQAEYQNDPLPAEGRRDALSVERVMTALNGRLRGEVPETATRLTTFVDVHDRVLFHCTCAWEENFTGYVIDYGTFPDQRRASFTAGDPPHTLGRAYPGTGVNGAIHAGLESLLSQFLARDFKRGGAAVRIDRLLVDMGYKPQIVAAVKQKLGGSTILLSRGAGLRANRKPMSAWVRKPGEIHGHFWYVPSVRKTGQFPHVLVDVNYWKTFVHAALSTAAGDAGALTLFGRDPREHELFAEHVARSEYSVELTGPWGIVREWSPLPAKPDNHWFDCLVGCAAAASISGVRAPGAEGSRAAVRSAKRRQARQASYL
jgi:hypothetical protein